MKRLALTILTALLTANATTASAQVLNPFPSPFTDLQVSPVQPAQPIHSRPPEPTNWDDKCQVARWQVATINQDFRTPEGRAITAIVGKSTANFRTVPIGVKGSRVIKALKPLSDISKPIRIVEAPDCKSLWWLVRLPSGAQGWVREDLLVFSRKF